MTHHFSVVNHLITIIILGVDFLQGHNLVLNFSTNPVTLSSCSKVIPMGTTTNTCAELKPLLQAEQTRRAKFCAVMAVENTTVNLVNDAIISLFGGPASYEYPSHVPDPFIDIINEYSNLFHTIPGSTTLVYHQIPSQGSPIRVPPRRIQVHCKATIEQQIHQMLEQGIRRKLKSMDGTSSICA